MGSKSKGKRDKAKTGAATPSSSQAVRAPRLTTIVPVRFEPATLAAVRAQADADGRSVSSWIRRVVQLELERVGTVDRRGTANDSDASTRSG